MKKDKKNQALRALKSTVTNNGYWDIEFVATRRYEDQDPKDPETDWQIDLYQLEGDESVSKRSKTFHPIEKVARVADVFDLSMYVTMEWREDYLKVHLF